jgi:cobalt-zinc-cadmium efflux system outer membrane protein
MQRLVRGLAPCIVLIAFAAPAAAQSQTPPALTLERAFELARQRNPELAAAVWEVQAAEAAVDQAGVLPNPELELAGDNLGNQRLRAEGDRTTSLQISQLIELGGKRAARVRLARTSLDVAAWESRAKRTEIVMRVKQAFHDQLAWQQRVALAEDSARLADQVAATVARRVQAGKVSPIEETKAQLARSGALVERERARRELAAMRSRLGALIGASASEFGVAQGDLERIEPLPDFETLAARAPANPEFGRWTSEVERRRAGIEAEQARAVPDVTLRGGVTRFSVFNDDAFMVGISIPLPVFDRNRGAILESHRHLDKALDEQRGAQARWRADLSEAYQRTQAVAVELQLLRDSILPGARSAFAAATRGYELGKFGILDVLDAQRALVQARTQYLRALADYWRGASEIERLAGMAL